MLEYFLLIIIHFSMGSSCFFRNPKQGELHPSIKLQVITKTSVPKRVGSHMTLRCVTKAPIVTPGLYNPISLAPTVINFFFNGNHLTTTNCPPGAKNGKKICDLVIPRFKPKNAGKYHCQSRNAYRCTTLGVNLPQADNCPAPGKKKKEKLILDDFETK